MDFEFTDEGMARLFILMDEDLKHGEMVPNLAHFYQKLQYCKDVGTTLHINF